MTIMHYDSSFPAPFMIVLVALVGLGQNAAVPFIVQAFLENVYPTNELVAFNAAFYVPQITTFAMNLMTTLGLWTINLLMVPFILYVAIWYRTNLLRHTQECQQAETPFRPLPQAVNEGFEDSYITQKNV